MYLMISLCKHLCVHSRYDIQKKMDFTSSNVKAAFFICFTLVLKSTSFKRKIIRYFVSWFFPKLFTTHKKVDNLNILYFKAKIFLFLLYDFYSFFL